MAGSERGKVLQGQGHVSNVARGRASQGQVQCKDGDVFPGSIFSPIAKVISEWVSEMSE